MKKLILSSLLVSLIIFASCKEKKGETEVADIEENIETVETDTQSGSKSVTFILESKSESNATGKAIFTETDGIVNMEITVTGLTPGMHAIHIHEKADCSSPDGKSAGGHWNPTMQPHGKWGDAKGYHKGDIGNFKADENGNGSISMRTDQWCIGCGDETKDILGKSIIIHQGEDDFVTQPTGDAGGRVSCGGIIE